MGEEGALFSVLPGRASNGCAVVLATQGAGVLHIPAAGGSASAVFVVLAVVFAVGLADDGSSSLLVNLDKSRGSWAIEEQLVTRSKLSASGAKSVGAVFVDMAVDVANPASERPPAGSTPASRTPASRSSSDLLVMFSFAQDLMVLDQTQSVNLLDLPSLKAAAAGEAKHRLERAERE
jgi:hypothetical protein